jgi:hypothetical protein
MPSLLQSRYLHNMDAQPGPLTMAFSNMEEVEPSLLQSRTYITWMHKKPGPPNIAVSTMEEVDAFLAPVKVQYLCNKGGQEIRTSYHNAL